MGDINADWCGWGNLRRVSNFLVIKIGGEPAWRIDILQSLLYNGGIAQRESVTVALKSHKLQVVGSIPTPAPKCLSGGMVDTADLESAALKSVEVRIFSWA